MIDPQDSSTEEITIKGKKKDMKMKITRQHKHTHRGNKP